MKIKIILLTCAVTFTLAVNPAAYGQAVLSGSNYTQNFNTISNGLPAGWTVRTNATGTSLGLPATFPTGAKSWGDNAGGFGNCAGTVANSGTNYCGAEPATPVQSSTTNRCLAVRQAGATSSFPGSDPGAAFVFQIANTTGLSNFTFSVDLCLLKSNTAATTWTMDYAVGDAPSSFASLDACGDPGGFGTVTKTCRLGANADNQPANVWIRVVALAASSGGTRDTFGIDNFVLSYAGAATATPVPLYIKSDGQNAVLTWNDASFGLQAASSPSGTFTNVVGATSPFTNALEVPAQFFRLIH